MMTVMGRLKELIPKLVTFTLVAAALVGVYLLYRQSASEPWTRDGQVRADVVKISPRVSGYLVQVAVQDNQSVRKGDLLFQIDPSSYQLAVDQAKIKLDQAREDVAALEAAVRAATATVEQRNAAVASSESQIAEAQAGVTSADAAVREAESGVASAQASIAQAKAQLEEAQREADRAKRLADAKAGSVETAESKAASVEAFQAQLDGAHAGLEQAQAALDRAKASQVESQTKVASARSGLLEAQAAVATAVADQDQAKANLGEPGEANVNVRNAKVQLEQAELNLRWTTIHAPADGFVTNMSLLNDTFVSPGTPFALFVDASTFRVDAYFQETKLKYLQPGDRAVVTLMGHQAQPLEGVVESIGYAINPPNLADTDAPSNLVPTIQPSFDWIRLAQRVPVRVRLIQVPEDIHLVSGMTASIAIRK
jgi:multidrug resistance efflux pump